MNLPAVPDRLSRSVSRAILLACLLISMSWYFYRALNHESERGYEKSYQVATEKYGKGDFLGSAQALGETRRYVEQDTSAMVILLREEATALGQDGLYKQQLNLLLRAKSLAEKADLDSLQGEAAESVGNVYAFCQDTKKCELQPSSKSEARWQLPPPALFFLCILGMIGLWYTLTQPKTVSDR